MTPLSPHVWAGLTQSTPSQPTVFKCILICTRLCLGLPCFFQMFPPSFRMLCSYPHTCNMPSLSHSPWFHQIMKPPITQFSPVLCQLLRPRPKHSPPYHLSECYQSRYSLRVRDQVSHPHKTRRKVVVQCVFIFTLLDTEQEDNTFWTER